MDLPKKNKSKKQGKAYSYHFPLKFPSAVKEIAQRLNHAGFKAYLVGGVLRDKLLKVATNDYDFATDAQPEQVRQLFSIVIPTGLKYGTVKVVHPQVDYEITITTFRQDGKYEKHRKPETVTFASTLSEDLKRRDFTINGLAYDLNNAELIDHYQGIADLENKLVRTIGETSHRFQEDALRMLRACRFCAKLNFELDLATKKSIEKNHHLIKKISLERIRDELVKIICSNHPIKGVELLRDTGLLDEILPELSNAFQVKQNQYHQYDVYYHSLSVLQKIKNDKILRLAALFHDIAKPQTKQVSSSNSEPTFYGHEIKGSEMTKKIMQRLRFSKKEISLVSHLVRWHMFYYQSIWSDAAVKKFINKVGIESIDKLFELRKADRLGKGFTNSLESNEDLIELKKRIKEIIQRKECLGVKDLDLNGNEIMQELNLKPSRKVGQIINYLLVQVLQDSTKNTKSNLLQLARNYLIRNPK